MVGKSDLGRRAATALVAGAGGALLSPAALPAADVPAGGPVAAIRATPDPAIAGRPLRLDASRSSEPGGRIVRYLWNLDGNGSFETDTGSRAAAGLRPKSPGRVRIVLRVVGADGASADTALDVAVVAPTAPRGRPSPASAGVPTVSASGPGPTVPGPRAGGAAAPPRPHRARPRARDRRLRHATRIAAAAAGGVTIQNFAFHPGTMSIKAGDSVTWTNQDSTAHTATATDGSFNTGTLNSGQSASHTFSSAGTFAYICAIHPNMHGTIVVSAASTGRGASGGGSSSSTGSSSSGGSTAAGSSAPTATPQAGSSAAPASGGLPQTGLGLLSVVALGAAMFLGGGLLRRLTRR